MQNNISLLKIFNPPKADERLIHRSLRLLWIFRLIVPLLSCGGVQYRKLVKKCIFFVTLILYNDPFLKQMKFSQSALQNPFSMAIIISPKQMCCQLCIIRLQVLFKKTFDFEISFWIYGEFYSTGLMYVESMKK